MSEIRKVKISNELLNYINKNKDVISDGRKLPTNEEVLKIFGIEKENSIEADDYFQFFKYFGNNVDLYKKLKTLKDESEVTWKDIYNIKWGDVNLRNNTVSFTNQKVKSTNKKELGI